MEQRTCESCGQSIMLYRADARTCSDRCRMKVYRAAKRASKQDETPVFCPIPAELRGSPRWVRWGRRKRKGGIAKAPLTVAGRSASSVDPATWSTYADAAASTVGDGLGFVLNGDGLAVIDLDHCLTDGVPTEGAQRVLEMFPGAWVEVSPSGTGLHIWGTATAGKGKGPSTTADGLQTEFYTTGRYMTVTGNTYRAGGLDTPLHPVT